MPDRPLAQIEQENADLRQRLQDVNVKDGVKTREINILTQENRELLARLAVLERERDERLRTQDCKECGQHTLVHVPSFQAWVCVVCTHRGEHEDFERAEAAEARLAVLDRELDNTQKLDGDGFAFWQRKWMEQHKRAEELAARLAVLEERLRELPRYNCDCLPNNAKGEMASDAEAATDEAVSCQRFVILAEDIDALLAPSSPADTET